MALYVGGAVPPQRDALPSASTEPSLDSGAYSSRSWRITFCLRNTVRVSFHLQTWQARAGRSKEGSTYRQCFRIRAVLDQRDAVGELLAVEARVLLLLALLYLHCGGV